jgi:hypothetical protein
MTGKKSALLSSAKVPAVNQDQDHSSADPAAPQAMREYAADPAGREAAEPKSSTKPSKPRRGSPHAARASPDRRDHHGFRGVPPPLPGISLGELADDQLLTEYETAAILRLSTSTLEKWRTRADSHPLEWETMGGRLIRYRAGAVKRFLLNSTVRGRARGRQLATRDRRAATEPVYPAE